MAILILVTLALGLRLTSMEPDLPNLWLHGLHKTLGITLLALILWHVISRPSALIGPPGPGRIFIKARHRTLYALINATPIAGWAGSSASGIVTVIAGTVTLPPLIRPMETAEFGWFILHEIFAKTLLGMVIVHILAALKREMEGDGTLRRMLRSCV